MLKIFVADYFFPENNLKIADCDCLPIVLKTDLLNMT